LKTAFVNIIETLSVMKMENQGVSFSGKRRIKPKYFLVNLYMKNIKQRCVGMFNY